MSRTELLSRLNDPEVSSEACFVLLWTYLTLARVSAGENLARAKSIHHFQVEQHLPPGSFAQERVSRAIRELQTRHGGAFDLYVLRTLSALDKELALEPLSEEWIRGLDGTDYRVRPRNRFLVDSFQDHVTTEKDQSGSKALYTPLHMAVPRAVDEITIEIQHLEDWAGRRLRDRLQNERAFLRIMLWPLRTVLDYPALDPDRPPSPFVSLDAIRNEEELEQEVLEALATARDQKVSILVFPELAIPPSTRESIRRTLQGHGLDGFPLLTLLGCCHCPDAGGGDLNEAVLLGPDGAELHRHRKLTSFTFFAEDGRYLGEQLQVGTKVAVLESPVGNLAPLICLDFLHMPLRPVLTHSHANLFVVPSLSPTTSAHQDAARALQTTNQASSFVSNRALEGLTSKATSFYRLPRKDGFRPHLPGELPYLLFCLNDYLEMDKAIN